MAAKLRTTSLSGGSFPFPSPVNQQKNEVRGHGSKIEHPLLLASIAKYKRNKNYYNCALKSPSKCISHITQESGQTYLAEQVVGGRANPPDTDSQS